MTAPSDRQPGGSLPVILLILAGLMFRAHNFWRPPLWIDEYGTWWVVAASSWSELIDRTLNIQGQTPLYYLLVGAITRFAGDGTFQLRLLSVIFGTATLALVYPLARQLFNQRSVALLALAIFALSEPFIWYSQIARPYALALFFSLASFLAFIGLCNTESKTLRIVYIASTALTIYAHYLFGAIVVIQGCYLMARSDCARNRLIKWLATMCATALLLAPAVQNFLYLHSRRHSLDWISSLDSSWKIANGIIYLLGGLSPLATVAALAAAALVGCKPTAEPGAEFREQLTLPILWYAIPLFLALLLPLFTGVNLLQPRYLLYAYPAAYFLLARMMLNVTVNGYRQWLAPAVFVIATLITVSVPALSRSQTFARWPSRAWNDALADIAQRYDTDGIVVAQIGFVEADLLEGHPQDPRLVSFLSWPLIAATPNFSAHNIAILPFRLTERTQSYFDSLLERAVKHSRVWLVGGGAVLERFAQRLRRDFHYNVKMTIDHGENFKTLILESNR